MSELIVKSIKIHPDEVEKIRSAAEKIGTTFSGYIKAAAREKMEKAVREKFKREVRRNQ